MNHLSQDSKAILLLCSDLGLTQESKKIYKPYTLAQWNRLAEKISHSTFKKPSALLVRDVECLKNELSLNDEELSRIGFLLKRGSNIALEVEALASKGIYITTRAADNYPRKLKKVLHKKAPAVIYYSGDLELVNMDGVAIVGSRNVDEEGKMFTAKVAKKCVEDNLTIVSGGAKGVDSIAESTALAEGGYVVSFVPDGLSRKIKEKEVRNQILGGKRLMLTCNNPSARFSVHAAMDRNKYIYALSDYAVVVSSTEGSGGTWAGATENLKKSYAPLFVYSYEKMPAGNEKLIELGGNPLSLEIIENNDLSLRGWLKGNKKEILLQASLF